jgi:8-oxo-dGTP diphosphatase
MDRAVRVGVGVIVRRDGRVLLGLRAGSHGSGTWALPGGHLEFGETPEQCACREVLEETGLQIQSLQRAPWTSDHFESLGRHYLTVFIVADVVGDLAGDLAGHATGDALRHEARRMEPDKCLRWDWFAWADLPEPLFEPLRSLWASGYVPPAAASDVAQGVQDRGPPG